MIPQKQNNYKKNALHLLFFEHRKKYLLGSGTDFDTFRESFFHFLSPGRADSRVEKNDNPLVGLGADQSSESLTQLDDHGRERIFSKTVPIESGASDEYRVGRNCEWEFVDDERF